MKIRMNWLFPVVFLLGSTPLFSISAELSNAQTGVQAADLVKPTIGTTPAKTGNFWKHDHKKRVEALQRKFAIREHRLLEKMEELIQNHPERANQIRERFERKFSRLRERFERLQDRAKKYRELGRERRRKRRKHKHEQAQNGRDLQRYRIHDKPKYKHDRSHQVHANW